MDTIRKYNNEFLSIDVVLKKTISDASFKEVVRCFINKLDDSRVKLKEIFNELKIPRVDGIKRKSSRRRRNSRKRKSSRRRRNSRKRKSYRR